MPTDEVNANYDAFVSKYQHDLERDHPGKVALLHDGELVEVHETYDDAYWHGVDEWGLGNFSIQEIGDSPANLGAVAAER